MQKRISSRLVSVILVLTLITAVAEPVFAAELEDETDPVEFTEENSVDTEEFESPDEEADIPEEEIPEEETPEEEIPEEETKVSEEEKPVTEEEPVNSADSEEEESLIQSFSVKQDDSSTTSDESTPLVSGGNLTVSGDNVSEKGFIGEAVDLFSSISTYSSSNSYDDYVETVKVKGTCDYTSAYKILDLVNQERKAEGLSSLTMDKDLLNAAMQRAAECNVYIDENHTRPSGYSCFSVSSKVYGENIACGQTSASSVMTAWMNSSGHKANILNSSYTTIGIGCFTQGDYIYWVQDFGTGTATTLSRPSNSSKTFSIDVYAPFYDENGLYTLNASSTSIKTGKSTTLTARILNAGFPYDYADLQGSSLKWSSGTTSVATVSSSGKVTGKGAGSSKIKAKSSGGGLSASKTIKVTLATPAISKVSNVSSGVKIKWGKVTGASGYYIYRRTGTSGSYKKIATVKSGSTVTYTNKKSGSNKVTSGKRYYYKVAAYSGSNTSSKSSADKIAYLTVGKLSSVKNKSSKKMTVKWTKRSGVGGYQIQYATNSDFTKNKKSVKVSGAKKTSKTISKLKKGKTYYVRVRTYKKVSGKTYYSAWSSAKKVKIKK